MFYVTYGDYSVKGATEGCDSDHGDLTGEDSKPVIFAELLP